MLATGSWSSALYACNDQPQGFHFSEFCFQWSLTAVGHNSTWCLYRQGNLWRMALQLHLRWCLVVERHCLNSADLDWRRWFSLWYRMYFMRDIDIASTQPFVSKSNKNPHYRLLAWYSKIPWNNKSNTLSSLHAYSHNEIHSSFVINILLVQSKESTLKVFGRQM